MADRKSFRPPPARRTLIILSASVIVKLAKDVPDRFRLTSILVIAGEFMLRIWQRIEGPFFLRQTAASAAYLA